MFGLLPHMRIPTQLAYMINGDNRLVRIDAKGKHHASLSTNRARHEKFIQNLLKNPEYVQFGNTPLYLNMPRIGVVHGSTAGRLAVFDRAGKCTEIAAMSNESLEAGWKKLCDKDGIVRLGTYYAVFNPHVVRQVSMNKVTNAVELSAWGDAPLYTLSGDEKIRDAIKKSLREQGYDFATGIVGHKICELREMSEDSEDNGGQDDSKPAPSTPALDNATREKLRALPDKLKKRVVAQDVAADMLTVAVRRAFAGLNEDNKPLGSFLFLGPTGVGKTEETRQLAEALGYEFKKIDMSEYKEKHNVARMIGSPPGYRDSGAAGTLTDFIDKHPHTVLLLDEIEKAHTDVYDVLLQVMDDARMTSGMGKIVNFKNVILVMTSNLGTSVNSASVKPASVKADKARDLRKDPLLTAHFRPEFLNRLDGIARFNPLEREHMGAIVDIFTAKLRDRLAKQNITMTMDPAVRTWLADHGHDAVLGARPLKRLMAEAIENNLADEILFGALQKGGAAHIAVSPDQLRPGLRIVYNDAARVAAAVNDNDNDSENGRAAAQIATTKKATADISAAATGKIVTLKPA